MEIEVAIVITGPPADSFPGAQLNDDDAFLVTSIPPGEGEGGNKRENPRSCFKVAFLLMMIAAAA